MNESFSGNDFLKRAVEQYADMVMRISYQYLKNRANAEDVTQDVFIKLIEHSGFNDDGHVKAWLIRVTINQCKDLRKSFWQRKTEPLSEEWPGMEPDQLNVLDELWKLTPDYRNVIYLHYYEGYTIAEIANMLDRNENTVGSWLRRAREKLKNILADGGYYNG